MLASLSTKLDYKKVKPGAYMQKLTHFTV